MEKMEYSHLMQVEIKIRLSDSNAHKKLLTLLSPFHTQTFFQENFIFDGPNNELATNLAALLLRFYNQDRKCILVLKSKPTIYNGISRVDEIVHRLDPSLGRACVADPCMLASLLRSKNMLESLTELGLDDGLLGGLVCLGGFTNVRNVHEWEDMMLEVDETRYDFGTSYELECESEEPEEAKRKIELELLQKNGIKYSYSLDNKFAIFGRSNRLLPL